MVVDTLPKVVGKEQSRVSVWFLWRLQWTTCFNVVMNYLHFSLLTAFGYHDRLLGRHWKISINVSVLVQLIEGELYKIPGRLKTPLQVLPLISRTLSSCTTLPFLFWLLRDYKVGMNSLNDEVDICSLVHKEILWLYHSDTNSIGEWMALRDINAYNWIGRCFKGRTLWDTGSTWSMTRGTTINDAFRQWAKQNMHIDSHV